MIIWGGHTFRTDPGQPARSEYFGDGASYNPRTDIWRPVRFEGALAPRTEHRAVWTGEEMIIWGGRDAEHSAGVTTGARYNPRTDSWRSIAPAPGYTSPLYASMVWTGAEAIVWGGFPLDFQRSEAGRGARWDPETDTWTEVTTEGAPLQRNGQITLWTGVHMITWGGSNRNVSGEQRDGGRYDPLSDTWTPLSLDGAPSERRAGGAAWTGNEMLVWGGTRDLPGGRSYEIFNDGAAYAPETDTWHALPTTPIEARVHETVLAAGAALIAWGGSTVHPPNLMFNEEVANDGAIYRVPC
jgi:N-acetylneuraminic acid mutarotase